MTKRRWVSTDFKARVALEALRGDEMVQEIAARHKVHPNQVSTWKRQAVDGLGEVFSNGVDYARRDHQSEVRNLHAKTYAERLAKMATTPTDLGFPGGVGVAWSEIALCFTVSQPGVTTAIVGTTNTANVKHNVEALSKGALAKKVVANLCQAFQRAEAAAGAPRLAQT